MEFLKDLITLFDLRMPQPEPYGLFHLLFLFYSVAFGVFLCVTHKKGDDARVRRAVAITAVIVLLLEAYKMFNYTFTWGENGLQADFQWYAFPWQFCSMPMYVGFLTIFFRRGRIHKSLCAFLATYAIFAGICVMLYPSTVFIETAGINVQTMICHGSMITIGIYLWYSGYVKAEHKTILRALPVFVAALLVAIFINELAFVTGLLETDNVNMFYVSPHCDPHLPVYSTVQEMVPYPWCLLIYVAAFTAAAYVISLIVMLIRLIYALVARNKIVKF